MIDETSSQRLQNAINVIGHAMDEYLNACPEPERPVEQFHQTAALMVLTRTMLGASPPAIRQQLMTFVDALFEQARLQQQEQPPPGFTEVPQAQPAPQAPPSQLPPPHTMSATPGLPPGSLAQRKRKSPSPPKEKP